MDRSLLRSALFVPMLAAAAACSGAVIPIAENNGPDAGSGKDAQSPPQDAGSANNNDGGTQRMDGGSSPTCSNDAGGNSCLCGDLICQNGQWVCGPCMPADAGPSGCTPSCAPGSVCVRDQIQGGAVLAPDDAGMCPSGRHVSGNQCVQDPKYFCAPEPAGCNGTLTCGCAGTLCTTQQTCPYQCRGTTASQIDCECDVP